jgi:UDP:flavonoid glycosyltransferase YjiC (YdhE family)
MQLKGKKILFGTIPADGHFNPLTGLAVYLKQQGCDVRWYTSAIFKNKLDRLDIPLYPLVKAKEVTGSNLNELFPERVEIQDPSEKLEFDLIHLLGDRGPEYFEDIKDIYETFKFDMMITDGAFSVIPFVKHKLKIPVIAIGISVLYEESVDLAPYGMGLLPPTNDAEREEYAKLRAHINETVCKKSIDRFAAILDQYGIPNKKSLIFDLLVKQSDLYLQIGSPGFEFERSDMGKNVRFIGALFPAVTKTTAKPWFDERMHQYKKIALITQGTVEGDTDKLLVPAFEALKDTGVLLIATTAGNNTEELRNRFPHKNLIIEDYIAFDAIMPFVNVYITNGGYSGTLLSIKHKLPMVAAGVHEGKNETCSRIGYFKLGVNLNTETPSPQQIKDAVQEVLSNPIYKDNVIKTGTELSSYDTHSLCLQYIKQLINEPADVHATS